jgi:murein DD-endopeptidase MepM/ murein hydrolase activator NlpD
MSSIATAKELKQHHYDRQITFFMIPDATQASKQRSIKRGHMFIAGATCLSIFTGLILSTVHMYIDNHAMRMEHMAMAEQVMIYEDKVIMLTEIKDENEAKIALLEDSASDSAAFFNSRLEELDQLERQLASAVDILNEQNQTNVSVPVSRSLSSAMVNPEHQYAALNTGNRDPEVLETLEALGETDEISEIIKSQTEDYSKLLKEIENQLEFLEAKPNLYPVEGRLTSPFGMRRDPITRRRRMHNGIDLAANLGTEIKAAGTGIVTFSGYSGSFGRVIIISHGYGYKSIYAHNNKNFVKVGERVEKGQVIGELGNTGKSTGPHVHFEIHYKGSKIDPLKVLKK